jgi:L-ascorbate metabolism protein UlaG (beta-lactamase superfamily)
MEITWYGHTCFRFMERGMASVVSDPYDHAELGYAPLKLKADITTISREKAGHNYIAAVKSDPYVIKGPGEYEIGGVFITAIQTNGTNRNKDSATRNTLYVIDFNGLTVVHLGSLNRVPSQTQVEALGHVNIALVPVGGGSGLNAANAAEVISLLEPNIVIPMHYAVPGSQVKLDPLSKFLKEMGLTEVDPEPSLKVTSKSALPDETRVVVLNCRNS